MAIHKFGVEAADLVVDAGVHQAEVENDEFGEEPIVVIINLTMLAVGFHGAVCADDDVVAVDHADVGMIFEIVNGFGEGGFGEEVVAIDYANVFSGGESRGLGNGGASALVSGGDDADTIVLGGIMIADFKGVVGGAVVPEDQFEVGVGLGEDGFDRFGEVVFAVVDGGDQGDFGGGGRNCCGFGEAEEGEVGFVEGDGFEPIKGEFLLPAGEDGLFVGAVAVVEEEEAAGVEVGAEAMGGGIAGERMAMAGGAVDQDEVGGEGGNLAEIVPGVGFGGEGGVVEGGEREVVGLEEGAGVVVPVEVVFEAEVGVDVPLGLELGEVEGGLAGAAFDDGAAVVGFDQVGEGGEGGGGEAVGIGHDDGGLGEVDGCGRCPELNG